MSKKGFHRFIRDLRNFFRGETKWFIVQYKSWLFFHFIRRNIWTVKNWCPRQRNVEFVLSRADFLDKLVIVITNIMRVFFFRRAPECWWLARKSPAFHWARSGARWLTRIPCCGGAWLWRTVYHDSRENWPIVPDYLSSIVLTCMNTTRSRLFVICAWPVHLDINISSCDRTIYIERSSVTTSIVTIIAS